jgi:hypothetical protein
MLVMADSPQAHVPEHGICVRCGMHLVDGRERLPCRSDEPISNEQLRDWARYNELHGKPIDE